MLRTPPFWTLPQPVTSFTIDTNVATLVHVRDIMARLPTLNDLSLSGVIPVPVDRDMSLGFGTNLGSRLGGGLLLRGRCTGKGVTDMSPDIPSGLHFTKVEICRIHDCLLPAVRLVEGCGKTLMKLSYVVGSSGRSRPFSYLCWF